MALVTENVPSTIVLRTADSVEFAVPYAQISAAQTLTFLLETPDAESQVKLLSNKNNMPVFSVPHVSSLILSKVLHAQAAFGIENYNEANYHASDELFAYLDAFTSTDLLQFALACSGLQLSQLLHAAGEVMAKKMNGEEASDIQDLFPIDSLETLKKEDLEVIEEDEDWEEMEEDENVAR